MAVENPEKTQNIDSPPEAEEAPQSGQETRQKQRPEKPPHGDKRTHDPAAADVPAEARDGGRSEGGKENPLSGKPKENPDEKVETLNPAEKLRALEAKLAEQSAEIQMLNESHRVCQAERVGLEKVVTDMGKVTDAWQKNAQGFQKQLAHQESYFENKKPMIDDKVQGKMSEIDNVLSYHEEKITDLEQMLQYLMDTAEQANAELEQARSEHDDKKAAFDGYKQYAKQTQTNLSNLNNLQLKIEDSETRHHYAVMHFLLGEFEKLMQETAARIVDEDALSERLNGAWNELSQAKVELAAKENAAEHAAAAASAKQEERDAAKKALKNNILTALAGIEF